MPRLSLFTILYLFSVLVFPAQASSILDLSKGQSSVVFTAVGKPSMLKISGKSDKPIEGQLKFDGKSLSGIASFDLNSLSTGISLRDSHMKEKYLETTKYPKSTLTFSQVAVPPSLGVQDAPFKGTLLLHGIRKVVTGSLTITPGRESAEIKAKFAIQLDDFKISQASFSGITMAKEVNLQVSVSAPMLNGSSTAKK